MTGAAAPTIWTPGGLERALVVAAHPDDIDFGAAGTVATMTGAGIAVSYCVVTNGDAGGFDPSVSRAEMAVLRQKEQRAAAAEVGVDDVTFLGYPDGRLEVSMALRRDLAAVIRRTRPDLVLAPSPERAWDRIFASHPDHLAAGEAAVRAVYPDARNPFAHPELVEEGLEPHTVRELWLMASPRPNLVVETTQRFEAKLSALRCHTSQITDWAATSTRLHEWGHAVAGRSGLAEGAFAEEFQSVATG